MTQEEKDLVVKDLSARLPYKPICEFTDTEDDFCTATVALGYSLRDFIAGKTLIKPYLRPLSSMTEEEKKEFSQLIDSRLNGVDWKPWSLYDKTGIKNGIGGETLYLYDIDFIYDYMNAHHFDYRGLIPMSLALPAKEGMYNTK